MTNRTGSLLLACVLCFSAGTPADGVQLPPPVLLDQLLLRTGRLVEADELDTAVKVMDEVFALGAEHELELPPDFRFRHARVTLAVGLLEKAKESITEYLAVVSREAESYVEAVPLLENVDRILERRDAPECSPLPEGSACWMELTSHPGCYVWNPNPRATETATWTGECSAGFATGPGTLTWTYSEGTQEGEGDLRYGRMHGESVFRNSDGTVSEGPFRFGELHGHWVLRFTDALGTQEGPYVDGKKNGHWVLRFTDARGTQEGPYVDGKKNGHWILRFADGQVESGPYVDDEQHGRWVVHPPDGDTFYVTFVRGVRQER